MARMGALAMLIIFIGLAVSPLLVIALVNYMFGTMIAFTLVNYILVVAIYFIVAMVLVGFGLLAVRLG